jgi:phosphoribosylamine--glycine ligase
MPSDRRNILIVGGGGREHALAHRLRQSPHAGRILCAPGNPGIARLADTRSLPIGVLDTDRLLDLVPLHHIDLVVIGPEAPLQAGLGDAFHARFGDGLSVFGCSARAALIESSKVFAKDFMRRHRIPTAAHAVIKSEAEAEAFLDRNRPRQSFVVKADGLRAGKGVTLCDGRDPILAALRPLLHSDGQAILEERLLGREATLMALCDGEHVVPLPPCEDHKTLYDGDLGPMTGGMGAICPTPVLDPETLSRVTAQVLVPAARGLCADGRPFHGLLYAGLMLTADGPRVLEFNCRFGDPETQALVHVLSPDLLPLLDAVGRGRLAQEVPTSGPLTATGVAACVVLSAAGYPGTPRLGDPIAGLEAAAPPDDPDVVVFHAGTAQDGPESPLVTASGRVLSVTARAPTLPEARERAYRAAAHIHFPGAHRRTDIGAR